MYQTLLNLAQRVNTDLLCRALKLVEKTEMSSFWARRRTKISPCGVFVYSFFVGKMPVDVFVFHHSKIPAR